MEPRALSLTLSCEDDCSPTVLAAGGASWVCVDVTEEGGWGEWVVSMEGGWGGWRGGPRVVARSSKDGVRGSRDIID